MSTGAHVVIVGGGPAGLTAALELQGAGIRDITVIEADHQVGGISRTVEHHGNRIDIGGHRFFSKSDWVMDWWRGILPVPQAMNDFRAVADPSANLAAADALAAQAPDRSLLIRPRLSRILYLRKFFDYPITLSMTTLANLMLAVNFPPEWMKHVVNAASKPQWFISLSMLVFILMFVAYKWWTKPAVFAAIFIGFCLFYFGSAAGDPNFKSIVAKPDNVPITMMVLSVMLCVWISFRRAALNDSRISAGLPLLEAWTGPDRAPADFSADYVIRPGSRPAVLASCSMSTICRNSRDFTSYRCGPRVM